MQDLVTEIWLQRKTLNGNFTVTLLYNSLCHAYHVMRTTASHL